MLHLYMYIYALARVEDTKFDIVHYIYNDVALYIAIAS